MAASDETTFSINVIGDTTGEKWTGTFTCKLRLSHRDSIVKDNLRRSLLGNNPETAGGRAASLAFLSSELSVRITDGPPWYKASDNGLELEDDNVLSAIYNQAFKAEQDRIEALQKAAEVATGELKKKLNEETKSDG